MRSELAGQVVLVTGGANGIGRAVTRAFAGAGCRVVVADLAEADGQALEAELRAGGREALFVRADATRDSEVAALVQRVTGDFGRLDVAVNMVGAIVPPDASTAKVHETSEEAWDLTVGVTLKSAYLCMRRQVEVMLRQGGGVIANTASLAGLRVSANGSPAYHAAKAGVIQLTRKAAVDYAKDGIRVNVVAPGLTVTERMRARRSAEDLAAMSGEHPMGRPVTPEEVAGAYLWACSPAASGVTGLVIPVDGGWSAR
jgi:NAD(P)-dependent dehydrogenase (short-subunit alcohol dehydrogenase family)